MTHTHRVVAIIAARNEQDVIAQVIGDLIRQRIDVYLIDDGSTDATVDRALPWLGRGLVDVERRPPSETFDWEALLRRKTELARTLDASWIIHHDADELRESPWASKDLRSAIDTVDDLGFNAIDFRVLNFRPVDDHFTEGLDLRTTFEYFEPAPACDALQIKAWRQEGKPVDLVSSGGHEAAFDGRRVFPIQFLVRHYPIRTTAQGARKIFSDRLGRFRDVERQRGWHRQYDDLTPGAQLLWPSASLRRFDPDAIRTSLLTNDEHARDHHPAKQMVAILQQRLADEGRVARHTISTFAERCASLEAVNRQQAIQLRASQDELRQAAEGSRSLQAELAAVYASRSWQVTRPLRIAYEALRPGSDADRPEVGSGSPSLRVSWGDLDRPTPVSAYWGLERGQPIDRRFIEQFLAGHQADIHGRVLEVKDAGYTRRFGGDRVNESLVLDIDRSNAEATLIADLSAPAGLTAAGLDCVILTQTLHIIFDFRTALRNALRALKPSGVLLCTLPAVSRINPDNGGLESGDFWRFTGAAVRRLFADIPEVDGAQVQSFGNVHTCAAFLYGLAVEDLQPEMLELHDPWFPLIHAVRATRRE